MHGGTAAVPRQCLVQRRAGVERAWLGRPTTSGRRRGAAGDEADQPLSRDRGEPETAERDADPLEELRRLYGHVELGVHAEVVEGGRFAVGDAIEVLPE